MKKCRKRQDAPKGSLESVLHAATNTSEDKYIVNDVSYSILKACSDLRQQCDGQAVGAMLLCNFHELYNNTTQRTRQHKERDVPK